MIILIDKTQSQKRIPKKDFKSLTANDKQLEESFQSKNFSDR